MEHFQLWRRCLLILSALFALQAVSWALIGSFDPFGWYMSHMARAIWGAERLPTDARRAFAFALVPFGASTAAYFLLIFLIAKHAFPWRDLWAYQAVVTATLAWFILDTGLACTTVRGSHPDCQPSVHSHARGAAARFAAAPCRCYCLGAAFLSR